MTTVYICEKPAQAKDIASILGIKGRKDGYFELVNGDLVTWAVGHLLQLANDPSEYNEAWGGYWRWEQLPMVPEKWKMFPNKKTAAQLKVVKTVLKLAKSVVIATDAGREGEMIARELLDYCGYKGSIKRLWTSSLMEDDLKKALGSLLEGKEKAGLYEAALARSHSDWLVGFNISRAATLAAKVRGDFFPVGRVQTPVLALVVARDEAIREFSKTTYYEIEASVSTASGQQVTLVHAPSEENRILDPVAAMEICEKIKGVTAPLRVVKSDGKESAPLPHSLTSLQKEANKVYGFSASKTLEIAQMLYEAKTITYPRTDCPYLASSIIADVPAILDVVRETLYTEVDALRRMGVVTRPSTFDDTQLTDHHGIIPTKKNVTLSGQELQLYQLVCLRFLQSLAPDRLFEQTKVSMDASGYALNASGRVIRQEGWRSLKFA